MLFDIVLQSVAGRKNPIGYWTNSHIIIGQDQRAYHQRMYHQMHQQRIYYAVISVSTRPYPRTIGYVYFIILYLNNLPVAIFITVPKTAKPIHP